MPWLVEAAAWTLNRYLVGKDGKTSYERVKGKSFELPVVEFAEKVTYLKQKKKSERRSKLGARTGEGIFLMSNPRSTEYLIGTPTGIKTSRTIWRVPPSERWNIELLDQMRGKPWEWKPKGEEEESAKAKPQPGKEGPKMPEGSEEFKARNPGDKECASTRETSKGITRL